MHVDAISPSLRRHAVSLILVEEMRHPVFDEYSQAIVGRKPAAFSCGGLAPWQERKVENYIESALEGTLRVANLAELVSLSSSYFSRAFKGSFGAPPHAYIIKRRIARARALMLTTSESLSYIAVVCGFVDQAHLCRCFRQVLGTTPGAWRRRHASEPQAVRPVGEIGGSVIWRFGLGGTTAVPAFPSLAARSQS